MSFKLYAVLRPPAPLSLKPDSVIIRTPTVTKCTVCGKFANPGKHTCKVADVLRT